MTREMTNRARRHAPLGLAGAIAALYATQGMVGGLIQTALPAALRDSGMALDRIGLLHLVFLPWALKVLWAPLVDRPGHHARRLAFCQTGIALGIACLAVADPTGGGDHLPWLTVAAILLIATVSATQDVVTDVAAATMSPPGDRPLTGAAGVCGGYAGFMIGAGLWLPVFAVTGWSAAMVMLTIVTFGLTLAILPIHHRHVTPPAADRTSGRALLVSVLRDRRIRRILILLLFYQSGLRFGLAMISPFLVDAGLPLATIGWIKGAAGAVAGVAGALAGMVVARHLGTGRALTIVALVDAACFLVLAVTAAGSTDPEILALAVLLQAAATAATLAVLFAAMLGWCTPGRAATELALFQCLDAVIAIGAAMLAGLLGQIAGFIPVFGLAAALLCAAAFSFRTVLPGTDLRA
ncbi:MFS transporter [Tistrella mobilis]|uniref:MFS transporter n=1 Tax=Tistrella mobilis TaxID=171437 RepID=UPI0035573EF6